MKSKILKTVGLIAAMVACIGMTVFAEPSPAASTVVTGVTVLQIKTVSQLKVLPLHLIFRQNIVMRLMRLRQKQS